MAFSRPEFIMDALFHDIRYALRLCLRTPGFTATAVLALALGIGANTAIFTIVNAALLERLPYRDPDRLVALWEVSSRPTTKINVSSPGNFSRWKERAKSFERMAALVATRSNLTGGSDPKEIGVENVTPEFFPLLGVSPLVGRVFTDSDTRRTPADEDVVVLAYDFWQRRFGGDPSIVGKTIQMNGRPQTVIGVMPQSFRPFIKTMSLSGKAPDVWAPYIFTAETRNGFGRYLQAIGRLKAGVTIEQAQAEMSAIAGALAVEFPDRDTGWGARVLSLHDELSGEYRSALLVLAGAVAFVLLIACANVANLLLARGAARQREIAIRSALGAGRGRVVRQFLTESLVLTAVGAGLALLIAQWGVALLVAISPVDISGTGHLQLNYSVLLFTAAVSLLTAIVCGLAPALEGSRADVQDALKDGARQIGASVRGKRIRQGFVVAEIALAVVLLAGAGLLIRSFGALRTVDPGFSTSNVLTMRLQLPQAQYREDSDRIRFFREAEARIREIPGVQAAGAVGFLPMTGALGAGTGFTIEGRPAPPKGQDWVANVSVCDNGYFNALQMPLVAGRFFTEREMSERSNVVIISESLANTYFPTGDAIGQRLSIAMTRPIVPTEVIGIVGDVRFQNLTAAPRPTTYWPHPQLGYSSMTFTVRTSQDPLSVAPSVEQAIQTLDKDQPVSDVRTMQQWIARSLSQARFNSLMLGIFASLAMSLAAIGIYGVMSYAVSQRTSETGVRLALGATTAKVLAMIVADGLRLAAAGLGIGVVLSLALSRTITSLLFRTPGADPITFIGVVIALAAVALVASYLPARRAARIPPIEALRAQ